MRRIVLLAALAAAGCFNINEPPCSFRCGPNGECPDDYQCLGDGYCHLHGTAVCSYSDAAIAPDLTPTADQGPTMDLPLEINEDMSMPDLSMPDLESSPSPSSSPTPTPTPSPTPSPTPTPTPTPTPSPSFASAVVIDQEVQTSTPSPIPIVVTGTAVSPSPAPQGIDVIISEQITPAGSASSVILTYDNGSGPSPVPMSFQSTDGSTDTYVCTIPGADSVGVVNYSIAIQDFYSNTFADPSGGQTYTYSAQ